MMAFDKRLLAAGGIAALALAMGSGVMETEKNPSPVPLTAEIAETRTGGEIKSMREPNREVFKADSVRVLTSRGDSVTVAAFTARVYMNPKYWRDAEGDSLRPLDLTIREVSALAKLNPFRTHDTYVDTGPYAAAWFASRPGDYRMDAGGTFIRYRALFGGEGITMRTEPYAGGMKETIVIPDSLTAVVKKTGDAAGGERIPGDGEGSAQPDSVTAGSPDGTDTGGPADRPREHEMKWVVETNGSLAARMDGGFDLRARDGSVPMRIERPRAWDADGKPVMASALVTGDTLVFRVTTLPWQRYPVTVDPTTTVTTGIGGSLYKTGTSYSTVHSASSADSWYLSTMMVGQDKSGTDYTIHRAFLCFPSLPAMAGALACTLNVRGLYDYSATDFTIGIRGAAAFRTTLGMDDFQNLRENSCLSLPWNSADYTTGWNRMVFSAAGLDSLALASGSSLWIAMTSQRDSMWTTPAESEYVGFYGEGQGANEPYLSFTYYGLFPNPPTGYMLHTPTATGMRASWTNHHTAGIDSLSRFSGDNAWAKTLSKTDTSEVITGLSVNTRYIFKARVDSSTTLGYSNADTLYTLANPPNNWNFAEDLTDSTKVIIGFGTNGNPSGTVYALRDSTNRAWISSSGDTTSAVVWRTAAQWSALGRLVNRTANRKQTIGVTARNGDGIVTSWIWGSLTIGNVRYVQLAPVDGPSGYTHKARKNGAGAYLAARNATNTSDILTTAADSLGQRSSASDTTVYRQSHQFVIPAMDNVYACSLKVTGISDRTASDFRVVGTTGLWCSADEPSRRFFDFSGWSVSNFGGIANWFREWSTSAYGATMKWPFATEGLTRVYMARGDTLRMAVVSSRDSSKTTPPSNEYIVIGTPRLHLSYILTDKTPANVVATAISADSVLVTWTDRSSTETGYALVDYYTGARLGGNDSTSADTCVKRIGGLSPDTRYVVGVTVLGGKLAGDVSSSADSCTTHPKMPGRMPAGFPASGRISFWLDTNGNPPWTLYAVQDSLTGRFIDATAEPETLRAGPPGDWGWRTYDGWGGASGDTLAGIRPGGFHVIRAKAKNGR